MKLPQGLAMRGEGGDGVSGAYIVEEVEGGQKGRESERAGMGATRRRKEGN